jgi:ComF family protein
MNYLSASRYFILDLFFPKKCIVCGQYGSHLCIDCAKNIEYVTTSVCPLCGKIAKSGGYCPSCRSRGNFVLSGIISAAIYDTGPTKEIIHHLKYSGMTDLSDILGELIAMRLSSMSLPDNCIIVPVPLHKGRESERGFNQSGLIGKYVANKLSIPGCDALIRISHTLPQADLNRVQRLSNLSGCFRVADPEFVAGKSVLLIDDVATTGTTLNECAKVLLTSGAKEVWGVVVAHG